MTDELDRTAGRSAAKSVTQFLIQFLMGELFSRVLMLECGMVRRPRPRSRANRENDGSDKYENDGSDKYENDGSDK
jgi:hypothetical protein